ncbi:PLP-dependent aminotransferase family protein [uncultured Limosilactobacillus sp.]|uniref:aminotransferase-like domain-containing protein n=1 Tax=uncultured Limosilactobacillus sp. TaxID=2837629 RepID=UPI0025E1049F|nr:PLP-dependent aminotransferase family protein [uncultured Limosilactobacillus sp.]
MVNYHYSKAVPQDGVDTVGEILKVAASPDVISFAGGLPAPELFPTDQLQTATDRVYETAAQSALQYTNSNGFLPLRKILAKRMATRGVECDADSIAITTGSQQSIDLISRMFLNRGDTILVEKPTYMSALDVFHTYGAKIVGVPMDEDGLKMDALEQALQDHPEAKFLYTVPTFQNPTGRTMPVERRQKLAELARQYDIVIIEDDPYGQLRFAGKTVPAVKSFDTDGRVFYLSTFSKTLTPGLRTGWVVADHDFIKHFTVIKQSADLHTDNVSQQVIARFLTDFDLDKHIAKIRKVYRQREQLMIDCIVKYFPANVEYTHPEGGLFIWVAVPGITDTQALFDECIKNNVAFVPGEPFYPDEVVPGTFRLNFSNMSDDKIEVGIQRLGQVIADFQQN